MWAFVWRALISVVIVVAAWAVLMVLARLSGRILDGPTVLSYLVAGAILPVGVWGMVRIWQPYLNPPRRPDSAG